jgi:TRAP-type C4-dicarboxylate transport system permease small subunit
MHVLGLASSFAVIAITIAIVVDVGGRYLFLQPLDGGSEFAVGALIVVVYLGLAPAQRRGDNFQVDLLVRLLPQGAQHALGMLWRLIVVVMIGLLAWLTVGEAVHSTEMGESSFGVIAFPIWPSRIVLAAGLSILALQLAVELARMARGLPPTPHRPRPAATF